MKVSVLIPTYNSQATIGATLDSILRQTRPADEILVLDDGSTDKTVSIVETYRQKVSIAQQRNAGVASARNRLCQMATGDLIAFLDHDDLWHPRYLETQCNLFKNFPGAAALFTGHINFSGYGDYQWPESTITETPDARLISPLDFFDSYNSQPGPFASMSFCCIPRTVLGKMGETPFPIAVSGTDDLYLCNRLALFGPVAYSSDPLVAYRIIREAQSGDRLKAVGLAVQSLDILRGEFEMRANRKLNHSFRKAFASKKRVYSKTLMGVHDQGRASAELVESLKLRAGATSFLKSFALLCLIQLPKSFHPVWPVRYRAE